MLQHSKFSKKSQFLLLGLLGALFISLVGCSSIPKDAFRLNEYTLENRQLQSRKFDTKDENKILAASVGVLQDMGYSIDESDAKLGVLVGSKNRKTNNGGEKALAFTLAVLAMDGSSYRKVDDTQKIRVSLVTRSDLSANNTVVRVTFQRQVFDMDGHINSQEAIADKDLYQGFFSGLSKSVFLEAHQV